MSSLSKFASPGGLEVTVVQLLVFVPSILSEASERANGQPGAGEYVEAFVRELPGIVVTGWATWLLSPLLFPGEDRTRKWQAAAAAIAFTYTADFSGMTLDSYYDSLIDAGLASTGTGLLVSSVYAPVRDVEKAQSLSTQASEVGRNARRAGERVMSTVQSAR